MRFRQQTAERIRVLAGQPLRSSIVTCRPQRFVFRLVSLAVSLRPVLVSGMQSGCTAQRSSTCPSLTPKEPVSVKDQTKARGIGRNCDSALRAHLNTMD
jgi:hypothetical protein